MTKTKIEWSEEVWNPVTGCTKVSPGCDHCYAERIIERFHGPGSFAEVKLHPDRLDAPLRWRKPRRVFVNSMSDLFHADVPDAFIAETYAVMAASPQHTFQVLTKRPARMRSLLRSAEFAAEVNQQYCCLPSDLPAVQGYRWPLSNVVGVVSVEDQHWADIRIPILLDTPLAARGVSCEPLLGPIKLPLFCACGCRKPYAQACAEAARSPGLLNAYQAEAAVETTLGIDWVIVGGESGPGARPMHPQWARHLRDQCQAAKVPFFFKQWGEWAPGPHGTGRRKGLVGKGWDGGVGSYASVSRVGKKAAGRVLDGRTWDEYPA